MKVYVSTSMFGPDRLDEILSVSMEHDLMNIELGSNIKYHPELYDQVDEYYKKGVNYLIHNYFPPSEEPFVLNLASQDDKTLNRSRMHCIEAIDLGAKLNCSFYSVHSGFAVDLKPELLGDPMAQIRCLKNINIHYDKAYEIFFDSLREINKYAKSNGMKLLIENNVITPLQASNGQKDLFLMTSIDEMSSFIEDFKDENIGVLADVGHLNVSANALGYDRKDFILQLNTHIKAFHLSENNGQLDQHLPIQENSWFIPLLKDFSELPIVIETCALSIKDIKEQIRIVNEVF